MARSAGASMSSSISDQVEPSEVGDSSRKPRLRASVSHVHRKSSPVPLPPCSATISGQSRVGVVALGDVEREAAAGAVLLAGGDDAGRRLGGRARDRAPRRARAPPARGRSGHRRQDAAQRIEQLLGAAVLVHGAQDARDGLRAARPRRRSSSSAASAASADCRSCAARSPRPVGGGVAANAADAPRAGARRSGCTASRRPGICGGSSRRRTSSNAASALSSAGPSSERRCVEAGRADIAADPTRCARAAWTRAAPFAICG